MAVQICAIGGIAGPVGPAEPGYGPKPRNSSSERNRVGGWDAGMWTVMDLVVLV